MKQSIQTQLVEALAEIDQLRARLASLTRAAHDGSAVPLAQTSEMQNECEQRLKTIELKVESLKNGFARQMRQLTITVDAYKDQIERLKAQAAGGAVTPRKFRRQMERLSIGKVEAEEKFSVLQAMSLAQSAADLGSIVPPPVIIMQQNRAAAVSEDIVLRSAGAVAAFLLLISVFMPIVSAFGMVSASLFQAGRMAQEMGDSRGVLMWLTPLLVALITASTSLARTRAVRGGILLALGTSTLAPLVLLFVFGMFRPRAGGGELMDLATAATSPGIGAFVMLAALAGIYILGGVNLHGSDTGKRWSTMTTVLLVLTCISSTVYCVVVLDANPSLTVSVGDKGLFGTSLDIEVFNGGNLPLIVRGDLPPSAKRNEFILKMQRRRPDEQGWADVDTGLGSGVMHLNTITVPPNMAETVPWPASFETGHTRAMFRAVLVNSAGRVVESGAVEVVRARGFDAIGVRTADGQVDENTALTKAREKVSSIEAKSGTLSPILMSHEITTARSAADTVTDKTEREYLHRRIDRVLIDVRNRQAQPLFDKANDYLDRRLHELAINTWIDVIGTFEKEPRPLILRQEPELVKQARESIRNIQLSRDPKQRFEVRGIMKRGDSAIAMLHDKLNNKTRVAKQGEKIDDFRVEKIDQDRGTVTLRLGIKKFELH